MYAEDQQAGPGVRLPVIPSRRGWRHEAVRLRQGGVNQAGDHADKLVGVMTQHDRAPCRVRTRSPGPRGQRADLSVAQAVEDQGEQSAGGGDHADVAAPRGDDPGTVGGQYRAVLVGVQAVRPRCAAGAPPGLRLR